MKKFAIGTALLVSNFVFASTPPQLVEGIDNAREGDLASKVEAYYDQSKTAVLCDSYLKSKTVAYKISSDSNHATKFVGTETIYSADYLVLKICFSGSTYAGAMRDAVDAVLISAEREGVEDANRVIVPSKPDEIKIVKKVDLTTLKSGN